MKKVHVYSHTHWDYEWYFTANESIIQLIYHMDEVISSLEDETINYYLLDGQTSILEEYLKYMPSNFKRVENLVKNKKLIIGPWYTQTDELIIDGESIVRNLFYGIKTASKFGDYMKIAYLPDSFGQTKDLPKIMNAFDIKRSVFWRGVANDVCPNREFIWKSEDDSSLLTYNIKNGYYYGGNLIYTDDVQKIENTINEGSSTNSILLPVGGDQRYVDFNLNERMKYYQDRSVNEFEYVESTCEKFFDELEKEDNLQEISGEFVNPSNSKIHRSIYSSRYDHKYLNDKVERRLIHQLEPLMVIAQNLGIDPKIEMIEEIWKKLLMNHAHDSACGCNSDKTNKSILSRLVDVDQLSYSACDYIVRKISESLTCKNENNIVLFNTLPISRDQNIKINITTKSKGFEIKDSEGEVVDYQVLSQVKEYSGSIKRDEAEYDENLYYYVTKVVVFIKLKPLSIDTIEIIEKENMTKNEIVFTNFIEDEYYKIELIDGSINIFDKIRNEKLTNCLYIEESGDDGDTYDYSPPHNDKIFRFNFKNATHEITDGKIYKELKISGKFKVPYDLKERAKDSQNTDLDYTLKLALSNNKIIDCHLEIDNKANDHRIRIVLRTNTNSKQSIADTAFGTIKRDNRPAHVDDWRELGWKEEPSPIYPMLHFVGIEDEKSSAILMAKGIKEYEIIDDSSVALTLFRSVGYLGKPDLIRRPGIASGNEFKYIETPDSQLNQKLKFKFAIVLDKKIDVADTINLWKRYAISVPNYQYQEINRFTNTLKYFVMHPLKNKLNKIKNIINCDELDNLTITSIIPIDKNSYSIRLLNNRDYIVENEFIKVSKAESYQFINMNNEIINNEKSIYSLTNLKEDIINLGKFKKGEIKTLKINI